MTFQFFGIIFRLCRITLGFFRKRVADIAVCRAIPPPLGLAPFYPREQHPFTPRGGEALLLGVSDL